MNLYEVLRRPLITEKATVLQEGSKYIFEVARKATKHEVGLAVEKAFKVNVTKVNVVNVKGKQKKLGRRVVMTQAWKKAVVTLMPGQKIEFFEGV
jgi:large subunit ribosomal protein L23